uniref:Helix-turn-helix domain-containing protein n=1 Tax=Neobacillus citreus TaxID=2833578 RepID=A0A942T014_9BACI
MARFDSTDAPRLVSEARRDAGLTQSELAQRSGVSQPNLSAIEAGRRAVAPDLLERILRAADYRPGLAMRLHQADIEEAARRVGVRAMRVFGSVARGRDHFTSDIDLVVDLEPGADLLRAMAFPVDVEAITGFPAEMYLERSLAGSAEGAQLLDGAVAL